MKNQGDWLWSIGMIFWLAAGGAIPGRVGAAEAGKAFPSPEAAVTALSRAVTSTNRAELETLFGPAIQELVNPDEVQGAAELAEFAGALNASHRLSPVSDQRIILEIGTNAWPFPIPLVKDFLGWRFDAAAGVDELLNRRIGHNELDVLRVLRAYVEAQREYASRDRDGDQVLEYAQKITSSPDQTDGLFWPPNLNGEISPLGPLVASAQAKGYSRETLENNNAPQPFHGYLFKILTRQGQRAAGGKYDYVINGNMIGGFALVAWPAQYGDSGVMTFIVNQQGRVYEKDLGASTERQVQKIKEYNPDETWRPSAD